MSAHLQRLLARVAPPPAGLALASVPAGMPASPLVDADQRLGMPEFAELVVPVDALRSEPEASVLPAPAPSQVEPAVRTERTIAPARPANPAAMGPFPSEPLPATEPILAEPQSPHLQAEAPRVREAIPEPRAAVSAAFDLASPLAISPGDFEPVLPGVEPRPVEAPSRVPEPHPGPRPQFQADRSQDMAEPETHRAEAAPLRAPAVEAPLPVPVSPVPVAVAEPAFRHPASLDDVNPDRPSPAGRSDEPGRGVVIEQLVIDIVAPPAPAAPPREVIAGDGRRASAPSPLSAEAASIIGPLPASRPFASLFGMRRR